MKNANNRPVIRQGDTTSHGGVVITASGMNVMGKPVALTNDLAHCPQCKGDFAILPKGPGMQQGGRLVAHHDDVTACGATLISSL